MKSDNDSAYSMAFTAGAALISESLIIASELRKQHYDWKKVIDSVQTQNMLSSVKQSSTIRVLREVRQRLELLKTEEIDLLLDGTVPEQKCMLWLAICKRYKFIFEFAVEVLREKVRLMDLRLTPEDYENFFHRKASWFEELDNLSDSTKTKVRTVLFRMLRELGFLSREGQILAILLPEVVVRTLQTYLSRVPEPSFMPDTDNVIPILDDNWFVDDIVDRFLKFLEVTFGKEHFNENLQFIENAVGKNIRKFFVNEFYNDHVRRYKKRPIYWMFSSPRGSFNVLIYMHRYTEAMLKTPSPSF